MKFSQKRVFSLDRLIASKTQEEGGAFTLNLLENNETY